ncbi:titin [Tachysurus fulvidraco]|uniref:titin n=1 Tax=Tachysurus fulvidraco TaxID=1234273 RepID=UPI001FEF19BE|nr:titin [Tachysurus fulvidraco]
MKLCTLSGKPQTTLLSLFLFQLLTFSFGSLAAAVSYSDVVTGLNVASKTTSSVSLAWNEPQGSRSFFTVNWTNGTVTNSINTSNMSYNVTGLIAGVSYTFTVTAVAADNQTTGASTQISTFTNPNVVTSLSVSGKTTSSVSLTWNKPQGNRSFFTVNWTDGTVNNSSNTSNTSYTVTGLTAGVSYTFTVTAVAADNQTTGASTQISAFTNPNVVTSLNISGKTTSSVSLTWNEPQGSRSFFTVNWTDGSVNNSINISNTSYNVTGLTAGVSYTFTVTAVAADNQTRGAPTQISAFTYPNVVSSLNVSSKTTSSVSLTWNEPQGNRSFFTVNWTDGTVTNSINTSNTSYNVTGLTAGVSYTFNVTAVAADNQTTGESTQISAFTNPNVVTSLNVFSKTTSSVSLTWNEPQGNRSFFTVNWTDGSVNNSSNTSNTSYNVTGLTAGVSYTFTVTAVAADNQTTGASTQISAFTYPNVVTGLNVSGKTTSSVSLTWNEPQGNRSFFTVNWTGGSVNNSSNTSNTSYNVTGLTAGVNYTFTVTAVAADNQTTGASTQTSAFTYLQINSLSVSGTTTSSVSLTWNETQGNRSFFIVNWTDGTVTNSFITYNTFYNVTGLTAGVNYTFTVIAFAADYQTTGASTQISAFTNPNVVTSFNVASKTTSSVSLTWNEPQGNRSFFIVNWTNGTVTNSSNTSNISYNVTGLTAGVSYTFNVTAVAADNQTTGESTQISAFTNPNVVTGLNVSGKTTSSVSLTWNEPQGNRSFFTVNWTDGSVTNSSNTSNTSYNVTGLTAGVNYTFTVTAVAADNQTTGASTQTSAFTYLQINSLSVSGTTTSSVSLTWNETQGNRSFFIVNWTDGTVTNSFNTYNTFYNVTGLTAGVKYTFTVIAFAADYQTTGASTQISAFTYPNVVTSFNVSGKTTSSVSLTWNEPQGNRSFFIVNWTNGTVTNSSNTSNISYNVTGLTAGVSYTFTVTAVAADNQTTGASTQISTFTNPNVVTGLNVSIKTTSVSLTWNEPQGSRSFFTVNWTNGTVTNSSNTSNTSYTVTGLTAGVSYTFTVTAVTADNQTTGASTQISAFTLPDVASNLTAFNKTTSSVSLTWNETQGNRSFFTVNWTDGTVNNSSNTSNTSYTVTGLTAGVSYTFTVTAVAADNQTTGASTQISTFTKPDVPTNLTVTDITTSSLFLIWTQPVGERFFFKVQWSNDNITMNSTTRNTFFYITDLSPGVSYTFLISAVAADNITEGGAIGLSVYTKPGTVSNLTAVNVTTTSISLQWTQAMGKISHYVIKYENFNTTVSETTEITNININNLTPGVQYTFKVFAIAADKTTEGNYSCISVYTKPDVPTNLTVTNITTSSLFLIWTQPIGERFFFKVQWSNDNITMNSTTRNTFFNITDLSPGVSYTFLISAVAADNITEGEAVGLSVYTKPGTVSNLTEVNVTTTSISLQWTQAMGEISHYVIKYENFNVTVNETTEITSININNLTPGVQYTFKVFAVAADKTTEGNYSCISAYTNPNVVTSLNVSGKTTSSVFLTWNEPQGNRSFYIVNWTNGSVNNSFNTSNTSYNVTGLIAGLSYTFTVTAVAADNQTTGASTQISEFTYPNLVTSLNVSGKTTSSVSLTWNEPQGNRSFFTVNWTNGTVNNSSNTSNISYNVTGLTAGVSYTFNVTAVAADNQTTGASTQISAFTKPDTVSKFTAVNVTTTSISLQWTQAMGEISHYVIKYEKFSTTVSETSEFTSININNLTPGVQYTFKVFAVAADKTTEGNYSCVFVYTKPDVPKNLTVTDITTNSLFLNWTQPIGERFFFKVQWSNDNITMNTTTRNTFFNITDLSPGVRYTFLISAVAADNITEGEAIGLSVYTKPGTVSKLTADNVKTTSISLQWTEAMGEISHYVIKYENFNTTVNETTEITSIDINNLTPGLQYIFKVFAVAADKTTEGNYSCISAYTIDPNVVSSLNVSSKTTSSVSITWNETQGSRSFFTVNWTGGTGNNSSNTSNTSYNVTGLTAGVSYTFTVTAVAADNQTTGASTQISAFTNPNVVTSLNVSGKTTSSVSLTWNEPQGNRSFFTVNWTNGSVNNSSNTSNTSYTVTGLTAGVSYTFTVTAVAADNQTRGASTQISAFTYPNIVTGLNVSGKTTSSVSLTWNEPQGNRSFYIVNWTDGTVNNSSNTSNTSYNVTGLTAGVSYTFTVTAVAADNQTTGASTQISTFTYPNVVVSLSVSGTTMSSVSLTWNEPQGNRSFFTVNWTDGSVTNSSNTSNTSYNVTGLTAGVRYTFTVTAVAADNQTTGASSQISAFTYPNVVTGLNVSGKTTSSVSLTWNEPQGNRSFFTVNWTGGTGNNSSNTSNTSYNVTGLTAGVSYTFTLTAVAADNQTTGASTQISAFTYPNIVTGLNVSGKTTSSVSINWNEPQGSRSFFTVNWTNGTVTNSFNISNTSYNVTGLTAGVSYTFTATAVAADNQTTGASTQISAFTNPNVVVSLSVSGKTTSSVSLTWNEPQGNRSFFTVNWTDGIVNNSINTSNTSYTVTGLTAGVSYTFTVTAVAADNQTTGASTQISAFTKPDVPKNLTVTDITTSALLLIWTQPIGERFFFKVQWSNDNITMNTTTRNTFFNIIDLSPGVSYTFLISAVAADNITEGEAIGLSVYTKPDTVSNLTAVNVTTTSILLQWTQAMGEISHYVIKYENLNTTVNETTEITSININNLTTGVQYTFKVFAVAADNKTEGNYSCVSAYTKPDVPTNLTVTDITTSSLFLIWTQPIGERFFFKVQWSNDNITMNSTTRNTFFNITDLRPGVSYTFLISAVAADNITEGEAVGLSVYPNPNVVTSLNVSGKTTSSVSLTWNEPQGNRSFFTVNWTDGTVNNSSNISNTSYNVTGLTAGVNYTFTVTAVAADNQTTGAPTQISAFTYPNVVTSLNVFSKTTSSVSLTWNQQQGSMYSFTVNWTDGSVNNSSNTSNTSYNVTGLTAGVNYTFTVTAVAADNQTRGAATQISAFTFPNVVTGLNVSGKTTSSVSLTWNQQQGSMYTFTVNWTDGTVNNSSNTSNTSYNVTGLTAGVSYTFTVTAVAADNQTTGASTQISAFTYPNVVTSLIVSSKTTSSVSLTWNEPQGISSFFTVNWTDGSVNNSSFTSNTSYNVTGLSAGMSYTFAVTAVAADGQTAGASAYIAAFTMPDVARNIRSFNRTTSSVSLNWNETQGNRSFFIVNWTDGTVNNSSNTSNTSYTVTGLTAGVSYTFTVTAVAADNQTTGASTQISAFTLPDVASNLTAFNKTTSSVYLTWNEPQGNRSFFTVNWTDGTVNNSSNISNMSYNVTGLTAGVSYTFTVTAVAADNQTTGASTQISTFTKPDVPKNLTVTNITTSSLFLNWTQPIGEIFFYSVQWSNDNITMNSTTRNTFFNITDLSPGVQYTFKVFAVAADNTTEGNYSCVSAYTKPDVPKNLTVTDITTSSLFLIWTRPIGERFFFKVQWSNDNITMNSTTRNTFFNITDLSPGVSYTFLISAVAADNITEGEAVVLSVYTKPGTVSKLTAVNVTTTSISLQWTEAMGKISHYVIKYENLNTTVNVTIEITSININNLTPGVQYTFKVFAVAADNKTEGNYSCISAYTKPDVPKDLTVTNITTSSLFLIWTQPIGERFFFKVQWSNDNITMNTTTGNTFFNITDLSPGVSYTFLISVVAADNITEGEAVGLSVYTKPDTVRNLTADNVTTTSISLQWTQAMGEISHYVIKYENLNKTVSETTDVTSININNLIPGVQYTFKVFAVAADNKTEGNYRCISVYTNPDVPKNLTVTNITTSSLFLIWTQPIGERFFFKVQWSNDNITMNSTTRNTFFNIIDLSPGVSYTFLISAVAADNITEGEAVGLSVYTKPDTVSNLIAVNVTTTSISLQWTEAMGKISHYVIKYENFNTTVNETTEITSININYLTPGVQYTFKVFAVAADNRTEGNYSCVSAYTNPDVPKNLTVTNITTSSLFLIWTRPIGERFFFKVQWSNDNITMNSTTRNTFFNITDLRPGVQYTFKVFAVAADNKTEGNYSCVSAYTKPDVPTNLTVTDITTSSLFLIWTQPIGERFFFKVQWSNDNITMNSTTRNTFFNITDLSPGVSYTFLISAVAADNITEGEAVGLSVYTKPDTVSNLIAVNVTTTSISLQWTKAMGKISHYVIKYENFNTTVSETTEITSININYLTPGVQYTFKVFAVAADKTTEGNYSCVSAYTKPDVPKNLTVTNITTSSLFLIWTRPIGERFFFKVQWSNDNITMNSTTRNTFFNITDLRPGVQYTFKVFAVAADNKTEGNYSCVSAYTKPDVPTNLTVTDITTSSLFLIWTQPIGERFFFKVQWSNDNITMNSTTRNTFFNITDLSPGVSYTFLISAVAADNITEGEAVGLSVYTKPDTVSNLIAVNVTTTSISLQWTKAMGKISHYVIKYENFNTTVNETTEITRITINNLTPGVQYTFKVFAVAADNRTEGNYSCVSAYTKPDVPKNLTVTNITTSSLFLIWTRPIGERFFFKVQWSNDNITMNTTTRNTFFNITDIRPGVQYTFKVFAVAADNKTEGNYSCVSAYTKPDVPKNLTVTDITTSSLFLIWTQPIGERFFFKVQWSNDNITMNSTTRNTFFNITDLSPGVRYTFLISAVAADNITEGEAVGLSVYTKPGTVSNLTAVNVTTTSISLQWTEAMGKISHYVIKYENLNTTVNVTIEITSITINNLTPGVQYTFKVFAVAADKTTEGNYSCVSVYTNPDVPKNLTVTKITTSSLFLIWTQPIGERFFFKVQWSNDNITMNSTTRNTFFNITDLSPGVSYTFLISAVAADNITEGEAVGLSVYTKPGTVSNLTAVNVTTTSISLQWTEAMGKISHYVIKYENFNTTVSETTEITMININNLTPGVQYTFKVFAVAADNRTEGNYSCVSAYTKPDVPKNLTVTNITTSSLFLIWTRPIGERFFFKVQWSNDNITMNSTTRNTFFNITELSPGVQYTFKVFAVAADNRTEGNYSCVSAYTKPDVPKNLIVTNITTSSLFLHWTQPIGERFFFIVKWCNDNITMNTTSRNTFFNITELSPGVSYTFLISAVAADNITEGEAVGLSVYTKPDTIRNLIFSEVTTESMALKWDAPSGQWSFFRVQWINKITSATAFNITNLEPGTNYTFAVSAVAADNKTEGSLVNISTCTGASPVSEIICEGTNRSATALLNLTWWNPLGNYEGFNIGLSPTTSDFIPPCTNVCNHNYSKNLKYFTTYNLTISTIGCGENGTRVINCRTGITEPPVPSKSEDVPIEITRINHSLLNLQFSASLLNDTNGPIEVYGVLLSTDPQINISRSSLLMTYSNWQEGKTKAYLTVLKLNKNTRSNMIMVVIGNNSDMLNNTEYQNGPLDNQEYRVALVFFTYLEINNRLVDIQKSIFSITPFSNYTAKPVDPSSKTVAIILGVLLPMVVLLIFAVIFLIIQKRRITKEYTDIPVNNLRSKISIPVRVEDFEAYFKKQQLDSNCGFAEQYEDLKVVGTAQTKNSALAMENKGKNRYNNVLPYDSSRVKLSVHGNPCDDYINANYISGYNSKKEYIAAQGPLPATVNEFWRMIWEKNCHTIVMLTKCYEQGRVKCEKYWPPEAKLYNNILVTTISEIELEDWTIRDFTVKNVKTAETRQVRQFHFTAWPDHGVPETTEVLINFRHLVREHMDNFSHNAPAVVHCSAGVGRTGTFIAVDHLTFQIERESMVDIYGIIYDMRMHRPLMVQTEDQYVFLNQCASDIIKSRMGTNVDLIYQNTAAFAIYQNVQR